MIIAICEILQKYFNWQQLGIYLPLKPEISLFTTACIAKVDCSPTDIGLPVVTSNVQGKGVRLVQQKASYAVCAEILSYILAASQLNKLSFNTVNCIDCY